MNTVARLARKHLRAPPTPRNAEDTRARVLDTAARLFNERGYRGATMRSIAQAAGIEAGSLYYHFGSKEELLNMVFELCMGEALNAVKQAVARLPHTATWRERLHAAIRAHLEVLFRRGDYTSANIRIFAQAPQRVRTHCGKLRGEYENYWRDLLIEAVCAGEAGPTVNPALALSFLFGSLNWTIEWYRPGKGLPIDRLAEIYTGFLFDGLKDFKDKEAT